MAVPRQAIPARTVTVFIEASDAIMMCAHVTTKSGAKGPGSHGIPMDRRPGRVAWLGLRHFRRPALQFRRAQLRADAGWRADRLARGGRRHLHLDRTPDRSVADRLG